MKNKLFVPHVDKTGGTSFIEMLYFGLINSGWEVDTSAYIYGLPKGDRRKIAEATIKPMDASTQLPDKYARIGMHHSYHPEIMNDDWFKLLVIREPLARFVSSFNFFRFEIWRDTGTFLNLTIDEYIDIVKQKNLGLNLLAATHINHDGYIAPYATIQNYVETVLLQFPWNQMLPQRGYISTTISLNAETPGELFTTDSIFEIFDVILDSSRLNELGAIMQTHIGININSTLHHNTKENNFNSIGMGEPLSVSDITPACIKKIETISEFQLEQKLWEKYNAYHS